MTAALGWGWVGRLWMYVLSVARRLGWTAVVAFGHLLLAAAGIVALVNSPVSLQMIAPSVVTVVWGVLLTGGALAVVVGVGLRRPGPQVIGQGVETVCLASYGSAILALGVSPPVAGLIVCYAAYTCGYRTWRLSRLPGDARGGGGAGE